MTFPSQCQTLKFYEKTMREVSSWEIGFLGFWNSGAPRAFVKIWLKKLIIDNCNFKISYALVRQYGISRYNLSIKLNINFFTIVYIIFLLLQICIEFSRKMSFINLPFEKFLNFTTINRFTIAMSFVDLSLMN